MYNQPKGEGDCVMSIVGRGGGGGRHLKARRGFFFTF